MLMLRIMCNLLKLIHDNDIINLKKAVIVHAKDIEIVDEYGNTPLLKACFLGRSKCVEILVEGGANLNALNYFGQNALTLATYNGSVHIAIYLMKHRSYNDFTVSAMIPPISVAIMRRHEDLVKLFWLQSKDPYKEKTVHGVTAEDMIRFFGCQQSRHSARGLPRV